MLAISSLTRSCALGFLALILSLVAASAQTETLVYSFKGQPDGQAPYAGLVSDTKGNFYGTTDSGGAGTACGATSCGTVFKVSSIGAEKVLYSFTGQPDGAFPMAGLVIDKQNNLYGTTSSGGVHNVGTVFKVTPAGVETVLYSFGAFTGDGSLPFGALVRDKAGNLYGTTTSGGTFGGGIVFKLTPSGTETVLHNFGSGSDGSIPYAGLLSDASGNLYGTTSAGGAFREGTVFEYSASGTESVLYSFGSHSADGIAPHGGLAFDSKHNLYGTTLEGGSGSLGTIFMVTLSGTETVLYNFGSQTHDGFLPYSGVVFDKAGNLYGTASFGGSSGTEGIVFELSAAHVYTILHNFTGTPGDGSSSFSSLILDPAGNLWGTTTAGGKTRSLGTVFKLVP